MTSTGDLGFVGLSETLGTMSIDQHQSSSSTSKSAHSSSAQGEPLYGLLSSLYHILDTSIIPRLEQAIIYSSIRAFKEASELFQTFPGELCHHPVIAVEHAQMLWRQWSLLDCSKVLEKALEFGHRNARDINDHGIYTLLRIFKGKLNVFTKGDFTLARDSMREVKAWLIETPISEYADIEVGGEIRRFDTHYSFTDLEQVQCLVHYYFLMMCAVHVSDNFDVKLYRQIPRLEEGNTSSILSKLRERLQSKGCLRQAQTLLRIETSFLDSQLAKEEAYESLLKACLEDRDAEALWDVEGSIRLDLATFWSLDGKIGAARQQFENARSAFERAPVLASQNKIYQQIKLSELKASCFISPSAEFEAWTEMFREVSSSGDFNLMTTASTKAANAALEIFQEICTDQNRKTFWQWQSQAETLLENAGDLYFLYLGHVTTGVAAFKVVSNYGAILQWHEDFEAKYPDFDLWDLRIMAKSSHQTIYAGLDDKHNRNAFRNAKEISDIVQQKNLFWEEESPPQPSTYLDSMHNSDDETPSIPALKAHMPKNAWFLAWSKHLSLANPGDFDYNGIEAGTLTVKPWQATIEILLRWVRQGVTKEQLSREELETVLNKESWNESADAYDVLKQLTVETFSSHLFGSLSAPTSCDHWSKSFSILSNWLMTTQDHHDIKKQFLLLRLQTDRTIRFLQSKCSARDKVIDAQNLLELESTVHAEARHLGGQNTSSWRNVICSLKTLVYQEEHCHVLCDEGSSEFQEILGLYKTSLKEEQERGRLIGLANTYMLIAELYYFAAQRLRPEALDPFFQALKDADITFQKMREGWKNLQGWEKVDKVLSASEEQRRLRIHPLAMGVIRQIPDTLQVVRNHEIWSTIQAAKSIGLGWLMRINKADASENTSPESLARYSDFQELPTITTDDVEAITNDVGGNVVYVDWYRGSIEANQMPCPIITTLSPGNTPQASFVKMSWETIDSILEKWLKYDGSDLLNEDACSLLQQLSPLLEPLSEVSKPGQVLVFSPTGDLHRVPLHAITIDGETLIRRNPIVYTSSLTVLDVLFKARKSHEQHRISTDQPFKAALFGNPPTTAGSKALASLSKKLSVKPCMRDDFTAHHFKLASRDLDLDLLHYHSHAEFKDTDPTEQSLIFDDDDLSLSEVFGFAPTANSYHATLLGCGSGMTKTSVVSGEVIGLVPAFLYSGAGSTVSTLWPFDDKDAALYTRFFYEDIAAILKQDRNEIVDLARANQAAVLRIMDAKPELYHWAPFILNGYWMMSVCGATNHANDSR